MVEVCTTRSPDQHVVTAQRSRAARAAMRLITGYQKLTAHRPPSCRYIPSCSQFALEAVETHGAWRGTSLSIRRLSRCHPLGSHGYDPVPERPDHV